MYCYHVSCGPYGKREIGLLRGKSCHLREPSLFCQFLISLLSLDKCRPPNPVDILNLYTPKSFGGTVEYISVYFFLDFL